MTEATKELRRLTVSVSALARRALPFLDRTRRRAERLRRTIPEITPRDERTIEAVNPYTITSAVRRHELLKALRYINDSRLSGAFVECGVYRGGNVFMAKMLQDAEYPRIARDYYLFDTFEGMPAPSEHDVSSSGMLAADTYRKLIAAGEKWTAASRQDVEAAAISLFGSLNGMHFVEGMVEKTLRDPLNLPDQIALLRLDTDWYESTKAELEVLYPRLVAGGVLVIDDYGAWRGAKKAVDEYFEGQSVFLHRVDHTCRIVVKQGGVRSDT